MDFNNWRMTKKDGKSVLLGSANKKGFHTLRLNTNDYDHHLRVAESCPVGIIRVNRID
jgi:ferredoxin